MKKFAFILSWALLYCVTLTNSGYAGLVRTNYQGANNNQLAFAGNVSNTDLINQGTTTFLSSSQANYLAESGAGQPTVVLNNGGLGSPSTNLSFPDGTLDGDGVYSITYNLNLATATSGYDLTTIRSFTAHIDNRTSQNYSVTVDFINDGLGNFVSLGNFTGANIGGTNQTSMMTLQNDIGSGTTAFASGVGAITFSFASPADAPAVYRELDFFGTATVAVPEPSSMLLSLGAGAMVYYGRRRRKSLAKEPQVG